MNQMTIKELVDAVITELKRLIYKKSTIRKYEKLYEDLIRYANEKRLTDYSIEFGEKYLKEKKGIDLLYVSSGSDISYNKKNYLPIRACYFLAEWLVCKSLSLKKPGKLASKNLPLPFKSCYESYAAFCTEAEYSIRGTYGKLTRIKRMFLFFDSKGVQNINNLTAADISSFLETQVDLDGGTVATMLSSIRVFFRYLYQANITQKDYTKKLPNNKAKRNFNIPRTWKKEDVLTILNSIDRGSPVGKRDYAILLLITRYGLRSSDVKDLMLSNLRWDTKTIEIVQSKTRNPLRLPLLNDIGWAIIDYLKYGRPKSDSQYVFLTFTVPYRPFGMNSACSNILEKYIKNATVKVPKGFPRGVHSLRHTLASTMLENDVPLPVISSVLGHTTQKATSLYLHIDINRLKECALDPEVLLNYDTK